MTARRPVTDLFGWIIHRAVANYWLLALGAALLAPLVFAAGLYADRNGMADWLIARDMTPVSSAETARDVVALIAAIDAALLTLYFSISLIVLTIAAGNLGVRLIDRWLAKRLVRVSIAGLSFTLIHAVFTMSAIDAEATLADTPLLSFALCVLLLLVNVVMMAVAVHDLGRTMFVDKAIGALSQDASVGGIAVVPGEVRETELSWTVRAERSGYVEGVQVNRLARLLEPCGFARLEVAPGQHVLEGQPLLRSHRECPDVKAVRRAIPIGEFRSDGQGAVFQIRLLVEIAARALSPAINDFYTGIAAVDALTQAMAAQRKLWVDSGHMPVSADFPELELPGQDFRGLFEDPLAALRQAAADYPSVSIRLLGNLRILIDLHGDERPGLAQFLFDYGVQVHEHASERCVVTKDRSALDRALNALRESVAHS